ncbi:hypothetical protein THAOC_22966, partial [Thalassiosira oceanica]
GLVYGRRAPAPAPPRPRVPPLLNWGALPTRNKRRDPPPDPQFKSGARVREHGRTGDRRTGRQEDGRTKASDGPPYPQKAIIVIGIRDKQENMEMDSIDLPIDLNRPPRTSIGERRWTERFAGTLLHLTGHPRRPAFAGCRSSLASKPNCATIALAHWPGHPSGRHMCPTKPESSYGQTDEPGRGGKSRRDR